MLYVIISRRKIVFSFQKIKIVEGIRGNDDRFAGFWVSRYNYGDRGIEILFSDSVSIFLFSMRTRQERRISGYDNISFEVDGKEMIETEDFRQVLQKTFNLGCFT